MSTTQFNTASIISKDEIADAVYEAKSQWWQDHSTQSTDYANIRHIIDNTMDWLEIHLASQLPARQTNDLRDRVNEYAWDNVETLNESGGE